MKEVDGLAWAPAPNSPYGLCGRKATLKKKKSEIIQPAAYTPMAVPHLLAY